MTFFWSGAREAEADRAKRLEIFLYNANSAPGDQKTN